MSVTTTGSGPAEELLRNANHRKTVQQIAKAGLAAREGVVIVEDIDG